MLNDDGSVREVRAEQPENMLLIFVTLAVLNDVRSREVSFEQPENMSFIYLTFDVLNDEDRVRDSRALQP